MGHVLMVQGTSSSAGKSLLVAALCRIFARRGLRVAPFKAQNMSNNAAVCADGGEIGRSQALQAAAAGISPTTDMNPILLKPEADARSQVIVDGRPWKTLAAREYFRQCDALWPVVTAALDLLRGDYDLVVIEGAGSPAEMNLARREIVNMAVARYCQSPVLLVGDIERGGVFAQLLGTLWLLDDADRRLVRGLIVNKFRGDSSLFDDGRNYLELRGALPVLGVVPWIHDLHLPEEDGQTLADRPECTDAGGVDIAVIRLPRISNYDDFDPLSAECGVRVRYVDSPWQLRTPEAVILPGTKSTMADLEWLHNTGLAACVLEYAKRGGAVVGICGGYQMLGRMIHDPQHIESLVESMPGLGLLPIETHFAGAKQTHQVTGEVIHDRHCPGLTDRRLQGYEIHLGQTVGGSPWLRLCRGSDADDAVLDGAMSDDGRVWGCYLHGLFANDAFRRAWLKTLRPNVVTSDAVTGAPFQRQMEASLDRLADAVAESLDLERIDEIVFSYQESSL